MPPAYVKPYVKRQKNDTADAEAICEAVTRANMRFVETKASEQQSCLMLHRTRHLFIRQQTAVILRSVPILPSSGSSLRSDAIGSCGCSRQILEFDRMITVWHRSNETSKRLDEIPGVGPALATALVASVVDPKAFRSERDFSAWIGLVPKQHSSRGRDDRIAGGPLPIRVDRYPNPGGDAGGCTVGPRQAPGVLERLAGCL